jgi:hypothetical protein
LTNRSTCWPLSSCTRASPSTGISTSLSCVQRVAPQK